MRKIKIRGVSPPHNKNTQYSKVRILPNPALVHIPMDMHSGTPAKPIVDVGDEVKVGQLIGDAGGIVSSPVHASVSGVVKSINDRDIVTGQKALSITIASDGKQTPYDGLVPPVISDVQEFLDAVKDSGAIGLGGAGYPTSAKLNIKNLDKLEYILVNGAECEPYITSDTRAMVRDTTYIVEGVELMKKFMKPKKIIICIEDNKPEAISVMQECFVEDDVVDVHVLPTLYPQGERKILVYNVTGRIVPEGARLSDVGCIVINCSTMTVFARYIKTGMPLVQKVVTVDGTAVKKPKNVLAPIGTPIRDLFEFCGGFIDGEPKKILMGGPMMGIALPNIDVPVVKVTNAVLAFKEEDTQELVEMACIKCGRCLKRCPMRLMPPNIETAYHLRNAKMLERFKVGLCAECGCCAYVCPSKRQLVQRFQLSKKILRAHKAEQKALAEKKALAEQKGAAQNG
ncbi:MAG: electron transport complex subunit RsxC [Oscillospiraceae bacterium]|nr:electron transport complex subunit RsxC [Oscillospiraceae bacterium]